MLDEEREAATALAHEKSPEMSPEHAVGSPRATRHAALGEPLLGERPDGDQEERFNFMPPSDHRTAIGDGQAGALREGAWVDGGSSGPTQVTSRALPPRGSGGAVAASDARIAQADAYASEAPAKTAALQAWHEAAATQDPPPERHANDSASERERQRCVQLMCRIRSDKESLLCRGARRSCGMQYHAVATNVGPVKVRAVKCEGLASLAESTLRPRQAVLGQVLFWSENSSLPGVLLHIITV